MVLCAVAMFKVLISLLIFYKLEKAKKTYIILML